MGSPDEWTLLERQWHWLWTWYYSLPAAAHSGITARPWQAATILPQVPAGGEWMNVWPYPLRWGDASAAMRGDASAAMRGDDAGVGSRMAAWDEAQQWDVERHPARHGRLQTPAPGATSNDSVSFQIWTSSLARIPLASSGQPLEYGIVLESLGGGCRPSRLVQPPPPPRWDPGAVLPPPDWLVNIDSALPQVPPSGPPASASQRRGSVRNSLGHASDLEIAIAIARLEPFRPGEAGHHAQLWACAVLGCTPGSGAR
jgi:hypothetical protein